MVETFRRSADTEDVTYVNHSRDCTISINLMSILVYYIDLYGYMEYYGNIDISMV